MLRYVRVTAHGRTPTTRTDTRHTHTPPGPTRPKPRRDAHTIQTHTSYTDAPAHTARRTDPPMRHVSKPSDSDAEEKRARRRGSERPEMYLAEAAA